MESRTGHERVAPVQPELLSGPGAPQLVDDEVRELRPRAAILLAPESCP